MVQGINLQNCCSTTPICKFCLSQVHVKFQKYSSHNCCWGCKKINNCRNWIFLCVFFLKKTSKNGT